MFNFCRQIQLFTFPAPPSESDCTHFRTVCFKCCINQAPSQAEICKFTLGKNIIFIKLTVTEERKDKSFNLSCQNKGSMLFKHAFIPFIYVPFLSLFSSPSHTTQYSTKKKQPGSFIQGGRMQALGNKTSVEGLIIYRMYN